MKPFNHESFFLSMNLNSTLLDTMPAHFEQLSRGFLYGDGLFETIRVFRGRVPFMHLHWARLEAGLKVLGFEVPAFWSADFFVQEILRTVRGNARVRISVWRAPGGLFFPTDNRPNFLITATALESDVFVWQETGLAVRHCLGVQLAIDALSGLKTLGGTRYVAAAMEARSAGVDDVVISNALGHVSEASSSNIFWIKGDTVFSPERTAGQVSGTFQQLLSAVLQQQGTVIVEKACTFADLLEADELFLTNAIQGIRWVQFLEGKELTCEKSIYFNKLTVKYLEAILNQKNLK